MVKIKVDKVEKITKKIPNSTVASISMVPPMKTY